MSKTVRVTIATIFCAGITTLAHADSLGAYFNYSQWASVASIAQPTATIQTETFGCGAAPCTPGLSMQSLQADGTPSEGAIGDGHLNGLATLDGIYELITFPSPVYAFGGTFDYTIDSGGGVAYSPGLAASSGGDAAGDWEIQFPIFSDQYTGFFGIVSSNSFTSVSIFAGDACGDYCPTPFQNYLLSNMVSQDPASPATPEPATIALFGTGGLSLMLFAAARRKRDT